jgi:hypothetical protein
MRLLRRADCVDGDAKISVGSILESHRTRKTRRQLAMNLALGSARADGAPAHEISNVLRRDHIQIFDASRHSHFIQLDKQLASGSESFVDSKAAVEVRIIDQPLPADRRAGLLEVDPHDDQQIGLKPFFFSFESGGVFQGGFRIVNRAWSDDNEQPVIGAVQDAMDLLTRGMRDFGRTFGEREFAADYFRRQEFLDLPDA